MKKLLAMLLAITLILTAFVGCDSKEGVASNISSENKTSSKNNDMLISDTESSDLVTSNITSQQEQTESKNQSSSKPKPAVSRPKPAVSSSQKPLVSDTDKFIGKWSVQVNAIGMASSLENLDTDAAENPIDVEKILKNISPIKFLYYTFQTNKTVSQKANREGLKSFYAEFMPEYIEAFYTQIAQENNITVEELLKANGISSLKEASDAALTEINSNIDSGALDDMIQLAGDKTKYDIKNGRIYFDEEGGQSSFAYEIKNDKKIILNDPRVHGRVPQDVLEAWEMCEALGDITLIKEK